MSLAGGDTSKSYQLWYSSMAQCIGVRSSSAPLPRPAFGPRALLLSPHTQSDFLLASFEPTLNVIAPMIRIGFDTP
jgi:hypothetical protein